MRERHARPCVPAFAGRNGRAGPPHPTELTQAPAMGNRPIGGVERRWQGILVRFRLPKIPRPRDPANAQIKIHTPTGQALPRHSAGSLQWLCLVKARGHVLRSIAHPQACFVR